MTLFEAFRGWQDDPDVHTWLCPADPGHGPLVASGTCNREGTAIVARCPAAGCSYVWQVGVLSPHGQLFLDWSDHRRAGSDR